MSPRAPCQLPLSSFDLWRLPETNVPPGCSHSAGGCGQRHHWFLAPGSRQHPLQPEWSSADAGEEHPKFGVLNMPRVFCRHVRPSLRVPAAAQLKFESMEQPTLASCIFVFALYNDKTAVSSDFKTFLFPKIMHTLRTRVLDKYRRNRHWWSWGLLKDEKDSTMVTLSQVIKCELVFYGALSSMHISLSC